VVSRVNLRGAPLGAIFGAQIESQNEANHRVRERFFQGRLHPHALGCAQVLEPLLEPETVAVHLCFQSRLQLLPHPISEVVG
jgi:hypothetical protein